MRLKEIETRLLEIKGLMDAEDADLDALSTEADELLEERAKLLEEAATRTKKLDDIANGKMGEGENIIMPNETVRTFGRETEEYRSAFFANLVGKATEEQRGLFADSASGYGTGIALPVATDNAIWDQVLSQHPILNDVAIVKSGVVMKVSQVTPSNLGTEAGVKGKKDSDVVVELTFTTNERVLAGKDYSTFATLSYAEAKMSQGAMEAFLVNEIATALGELLAKDVFATITTEAAANEVTGQTSYFAAIKAALGKATQAQAPKIYAKPADYYAILGEVDDNGQPIVREGVVLGAVLEKDAAAAKITVVDPALFLMNVVAETQVKSSDDVKAASYVIGGYMRAEGCLRKTNAASFITM